MNFKFLAISFTFLASVVNASPFKRQGTPQVITSCTQAGTVALTFDDGPYIYSSQIVQILNDNGVKGTFFFNGNNYGCIYDDEMVQRVQNVYTNGHQVGSHTWSHSHLPSLSVDKLKFELGSVHEAITKITGATPAFMRPPYGEYNDNVVSIASSLGESVVIWDFDSEDSLGASPSKQKSSYDALVSGSNKPSSILSLEHEVYETTATEVLSYVINGLKAAGYRLVTVAECVGASPYSSVGTPAARDASWTCGTH